MQSLPSFLAASGRIAPRSFVFAITGVYFLSFLSQFLLATPVVARASVIPFVLVQALTSWWWYALHARRLHDGGRNVGTALAVASLYSLGIVLLLLIFILLSAVAPAKTMDTDPASAGNLELFLIFYLLGRLIGDPDLGVFGYVMLCVMVLIIAPMLISVVYSVWAALLPRFQTRGEAQRLNER